MPTDARAGRLALLLAATRAYLVPTAHHPARPDHGPHPDHAPHPDHRAPPDRGVRLAAVADVDGVLATAAD